MWKKIAIVIGVLVLCAVGYGAWMMRSQAEEIPTELGPIDPQKLAALMLPGDSGMPDFKLADKQGKTVFIVVGDRESMSSGEEKVRNLALNHWEYPETVEGYIVGDVKGFELFKSKITEIMGFIRPELRFPMYIDFKGDVFDTFRLPRGHAGTAVVDASGEVVFRHSGEMEQAKIDELKKLLQATEPATPAAPTFAIGELSNESCKGKVCIVANLPKPLPRSEIPGIKDGFEGDEKQSFEKLKQADLRLASLLIKIDEKLEDADKLAGVIVGDTPDVTYKHLQLVAPGDGGEAFAGLASELALEKDAAAMVVIDPEGKVVFAEHGVIPMYKMGRVSALLGIEIDDKKHGED